MDAALATDTCIVRYCVTVWRNALQYSNGKIFMHFRRILNIEHGISNYEVLLPTSTFNIPCSIFDI